MTDLILRPWQKQDAQALAAIANNRNIWNNMRNFFPSPYTVADALQWIHKTAAEKQAQHFAMLWQQKLVGGCGCIPKDDVYRKNIEIGYYVGEPYWGNGIASEATRLLCAYIGEHKKEIVRIEANVFQHNQASMRVLQKNGFYLEAIRQKAVFKNNELIDEYLWVKYLA